MNKGLKDHKWEVHAWEHRSFLYAACNQELTFDFLYGFSSLLLSLFSFPPPTFFY